MLVSDLVATRVGLNSTDLECLDLLYLAGATTAGRLAAHTGLTSGATTAAIDRLEHAGFVTRRRDSTDRRVVLVEVVEAGAKLILPFYRPIIGGMEKVQAKFSDQQLATVLRYFTESLDAMSNHVAWLQTQPALSRHRCRQPMTHVPVHSAAAVVTTTSPPCRAAVAASRRHRGTTGDVPAYPGSGTGVSAIHSSALVQVAAILLVAFAIPSPPGPRRRRRARR